MVHDGACGVVEQKVKFPVWFDPEANGQTPMCEAFAAAGLAVKGFIDEFPAAYPPIILNLTDGLPSDGNPQENARAIRKMTTSDGNALVFNLMLSKTAAGPDYFPATEDFLSDNCAETPVSDVQPASPQVARDRQVRGAPRAVGRAEL